MNLRLALLAACAASLGLRAAEPLVDADSVTSVYETGAVPDGRTLCTAAIQQGIDRCAARGGGTVYFPPGQWLSGTLHLKSNVALYLEAGATLLGSAEIKDYSATPRAARRSPRASPTDSGTSRPI